jgi:hypothetical protein
MGAKRVKGLDDEAVCKDDDSGDESSESGSDNSLDDFIASDANENVPSAAAKKRPRGRPRKGAPPVQDKPPGHSSFPTNDFSITVTKTKDDVGLDALDAVDIFIQKHCLKGGVATEVGQRVFQLHLQCVVKMHWPGTKERCQTLQKFIKALLPASGTKYKVNVKACRGGQTFTAMLGYITKDRGKSVSPRMLPTPIVITTNSHRSGPLPAALSQHQPSRDFFRATGSQCNAHLLR